MQLLGVALLFLVAELVAAPRLVVGTARGFPGRTVEVTMSLRYRTNDLRDIVALQADIAFDSVGLTQGPLTVGPITTTHVVDSTSPSVGTWRLLVYSPSNSALTNGEIARVSFTVAPDDFRNFELRLENVIMVRADASQVFGETVDGAIAVTQVYLSPGGLGDGFLDVATNGTERCFVIQATTDFRTWINLQTNKTDNSLLQFFDPQAGLYLHRFYRGILCEP